MKSQSLRNNYIHMQIWNSSIVREVKVSWGQLWVLVDNCISCTWVEFASLGRYFLLGHTEHNLDVFCAFLPVLLLSLTDFYKAKLERVLIIECSLIDLPWIYWIQWIVTKSKSEMATRNSLCLAINTFPNEIVKEMFITTSGNVPFQCS